MILYQVGGKTNPGRIAMTGPDVAIANAAMQEGKITYDENEALQKYQMSLASQVAALPSAPYRVLEYLPTMGFDLAAGATHLARHDRDAARDVGTNFTNDFTDMIFGRNAGHKTPEDVMFDYTTGMVPEPLFKFLNRVKEQVDLAFPEPRVRNLDEGTKSNVTLLDMVGY